MSWFYYGDYKRRSHRKGVALRVSALPPDLRREVEPLRKKNERIDYVLVKELLPKDCVLLEFHMWTNGQRVTMPCRHAVIQLSTPENPVWICEGDLGRGCVESKR